MQVCTRVTGRYSYVGDIFHRSRMDSWISSRLFCVLSVWL